MSGPRPPGRIVTFYSYKGGTGRSMALANVAFVLAAAGQRVLAIDWDLEAPGLHRYFRPFLIDQELTASDGLIDLVDRYASEAIAPRPEGGGNDPDWWRPLADIDDHVLSLDFPHFPAGGKIDLLPAGRQTESYGHKVSAFDWQTFYDRLGGGGFLDALRERMRAEYDWVLIDSRTGVSDTAGICTVQMPDALVVCFTYNNQSIQGTAAIAAAAGRQQAALAEQRRQACARDGGAPPDERPYRVFPVPMRVDAGESDRLALRQQFAREVFAPLLGHLQGRDPIAYWSAVEVPHKVFYAYEEVLAPFKDDARDPKSVLAAFVRLTGWFSDGEVADLRLPLAPEVRQRYLDAFAETPQAARAPAAAAPAEGAQEALVRKADEALLKLPEDERERARSVLCRLVRLGREEDGGGVFPVRVAWSEFDPEFHRTILQLLASDALMQKTSEARTEATTQIVGRAEVLALRDGLATGWPTLQQWLAEDREFILWRQRLRDARHDWERARDPGSLLAGAALGEARLWLRRRARDLNQSEREFIEASIAAEAAAASVPTAVVPPSMAAEPPAPMRSAAPRWPRLLGYALLALLVVGGLVYSLGNRAPSTTPPPVAVEPAPGATPPAAVPGPDIATLTAEGDRLYEAGQLDQAAAAYRQALDASPGNGDVAIKLARILDRNGDYGGSAALYAKAIELAPKSAQPLIERAASEISQRRFKEALADLEQARRIEPSNALACYNQGVALEALGRPAEAITAYGDALRWQADMVPALLARARLQEKTAPEAARADYQTAQLLPATDAEIKLAQQSLARLGATKTVQALPAGQPRVFIQYSNAADGARAEALRRQLAAQLTQVALPGVEKVSVAGASEVRYFFDADRELAQQVSQAAQALLAKEGLHATLPAVQRDAKAYPNAQAGTVELWLPSLAAGYALPPPVRTQLRPPPAKAPAKSPAGAN